MEEHSKRNKKQRVMWVTLSFLAALVAMAIIFKDEGFAYITKHKDTNSNITSEIDTKILKEQEKMEATILEESKESTFDQPYIKLDPFGNSPLSAVVIFKTEEATQVSFTVKGKEADTDIKKTIDGYSKEHQIPILGLYPDYENTVEMIATNKSEETKSKTIMIQTEKLPENIPDVTIEKIEKEKMEVVENGLTFGVPSTKYTIGFDANGDIRWYSSRYSSHVFKTLENGHFLLLSKDTNKGTAYNRLLEMDYTGRIYNVYAISENTAVSESGDSEKTVVHHDAIELPSGNLLLTVNDGGGVYIEDTMIEIDRESGKVKKVIDLKDILPESFYKDYSSTTREDGLIDWFHQNAIVYDQRDDSIIISGRNQDTIMKLDYATNDIIWILSDEEGWPKEYEKYLIKGTGDQFKFTGGQHAPIILSESSTDQNEDTVDILVYDNNVFVTRGNEELSKKYSAASQYRINEKTKTAELLWTYGAERGEELFTNIIGSARYMENTGNRLIDFGWVQNGTKSHIVEVDSQEPAHVVFEAVISDFPQGSWMYRAERMSLYPEKWEFEISADKK